MSLFALFYSAKTGWIAGNNTTATADKLTSQGCALVGEWRGREVSCALQDTAIQTLEPLDLDKVQLIIFTSGSSGEAKAINKSLGQLQCEINALEQQWGNMLGQAMVLSTVSHQHIYGLLFRVLWPLAAGRCFHSELFLSPEPLLKVANGVSAIWVASPAQLKRLDELTCWQELAKLTAIYSSGGRLASGVSRYIQQCCGHKVIEVYGSSETGGIAWRRSVDDTLWTPFTRISISEDGKGQCQLFSPYLTGDKGLVLDDKIKLYKDGKFELLGRIDRIVKIEEKRLSLDELEQALKRRDWVQQSYTFLLADRRDKIAAVLVLSDVGQELLQHHGRKVLIKQLRKQLMDVFESIMLPRKWIFMQTLPQTIQGKIDHQLLTHLLTLDTKHYPLIQYCDLQADSLVLHLIVHSGLVYFAGHFPQQPILPGVTQLAWVETLGKILFKIESPFLRMEVIKFKKIIRPGELVQMELKWKADTGKLYFDLSSSSDSFSSGRLVYRVY